MVKTTLYLEDETASALKRIARTQGRTQSDVIREALSRYAGAAPPPAPQGIGGYRSGRRDVSAKAEEILRRRAKAGR
jgi:ribbon-helix-helix CopG family protein